MSKKIILFILIFIALFSLFNIQTANADNNNLCEEKEIIITKYKSKESAQWLWDTLNKYTENEYITAGIMGYFWRESKFRSDAVAGWPTSSHATGKDYCALVTDKVDEGLMDGSSKKYFIDAVHNQFGGYGLGQWYAMTYLETFYDFAQDWGTSIADAEMQCAFVVWSLENQTPDVWEYITKSKNPEKIGRRIGLLYDGSTTGYEYMGRKAQHYYDKYHN